MKAIYIRDCLSCIFSDKGWNCGLTHLDCKLEDRRSCIDPAKIGSGFCYCPEIVPPPDWCPLPVRVMLDVKAEIDKARGEK